MEREQYVVSVIVLESVNRNKGTLHQKRVRPPLCHLHRYLHMVTYLHISVRGILCTCVFLVYVV